jgi:hypothetical protein
MRDLATRVLLVIIGVGNALVGLWAALAPQSFYDDFPGAGRHWVALDGPFNEHLVRDVGSLNLALAAVVIAALVRPGRYLVQVAAGAELVYSLPHFLYHATHLDPYAGSDKVALLVSLSVSIVAPVVLLVFSSRAADQAITKVA